MLEMGLPLPEADAYVQLLHLATDEPISGYQLAKSLAKDPTSVYKALKNLENLGAIEATGSGEGQKGKGKARRYRPVDPEIFTRSLVDNLREKRTRAIAELSRIQKAKGGNHVYTLRRRRRVEEQFETYLRACEKVALLELSPELVIRFSTEIQEAIDRGVNVVLLAYAPVQLSGARFVVHPEADTLRELSPGHILQGVFDCRRMISAIVDVDPEQDEVRQAVYSEGLFLAYQAHNGLASQIIHASMRGTLLFGLQSDDILQLHDELARAIHLEIDWEDIWGEQGFTQRQKSEEARATLPWGERRDDLFGPAESPSRNMTPASERLRFSVASEQQKDPDTPKKQRDEADEQPANGEHPDQEIPRDEGISPPEMLLDAMFIEELDQEDQSTRYRYLREPEEDITGYTAPAEPVPPATPAEPPDTPGDTVLTELRRRLRNFQNKGDPR